MDIFKNKDLVKVCAPMVRYTKLQFRNLVRKYNCDLCFTPMILADSFCKSIKARNNEFTTNSMDTPVIVQFAANKATDFVNAATLVSPYSNGVDLNCGCPQRWAIQQGLGCVMLENPQTIFDIVRSTRNKINKPFSISVKIRIQRDLRKTVELCRQIEKSGASFLTVHARTPDLSTGPINICALKTVKDSLSIPVLANGGVKSLEECHNLQDLTNCDGIMVANGLLENPALFAGYNSTPLDCVKNWLDICFNSTISPENYSLFHDETYPVTIQEKPLNLNFQCFHHHLVFMIEKLLPKKKRRIFNSLQRFSSVLDYLYEHLNVKPSLYDEKYFNLYLLNNLSYSLENEALQEYTLSNKENDCQDKDQGKYFNSFIQQESCDWTNIFLENG